MLIEAFLADALALELEARGEGSPVASRPLLARQYDFFVLHAVGAALVVVDRVGHELYLVLEDLSYAWVLAHEGAVVLGTLDQPGQLVLGAVGPDELDDLLHLRALDGDCGRKGAAKLRAEQNVDFVDNQYLVSPRAPCKGCQLGCVDLLFATQSLAQQRLLGHLSQPVLAAQHLQAVLVDRPVGHHLLYSEAFVEAPVLLLVALGQLAAETAAAHLIPLQR